MRSCSTNRPHDPRELDPNGAEAIAKDAENGFAVHVPVRQEVDVRKRMLGPGVDAQMRLREEQDTGDGAVRKDRELLAHDTQGPRVGGSAQEAAQPLAVGEDGRIPHPRVEGVQEHAVGWVGSRGSFRASGLGLEHSDLLRSVDVEAPPQAEEELSGVLLLPGQATPRKRAELTVI
jgi:hypothetical protein